MSDEPAAPAPFSSPTSTPIRDSRWLGGGIWAGLLAALLVTSVASVESFTQGSIVSRYFGTQNVVLGSVNGATDANHTLAAAGLIMSGIAALALLAAWFAFVRTTRSLVLAYSDAGMAESEEPAAAEWLAETQDVAGKIIFRAAPLDLLMFVGLAWAAIVMTPAVLGTVAAFA